MLLDEEYYHDMPPKKAKRGCSDADDESDDYKKKRIRNNEAVKKCRLQSRQRTQQTFTRVSKLKEENQVLEEKVKTLTKELQFLKELFLAHASKTQNAKYEGINLEELLEDVPGDKDDKK
ncbi:hypothetical protein O0L34_g3461 [Tuta absoluta]|nr:hypothetical protein O0L34_g3461 [Tuta absoluta]